MLCFFKLSVAFTLAFLPVTINKAWHTFNDLMEQTIQIRPRCTLIHYPLKQIGSGFWKEIGSKGGPGNEKGDMALGSVLWWMLIATVEHHGQEHGP